MPFSFSHLLHSQMIFNHSKFENPVAMVIICDSVSNIFSFFHHHLNISISFVLTEFKFDYIFPSMKELLKLNQMTKLFY